MASDASYAGQADLSALTSEKNALAFIVRMILGELATATLVQVKAVAPNDDSLAIGGTVDVVPMVNMLDGSNNAIPHGTLHKLPFFRLQGGTNAVQIDPKVGDIGLAVFASRDISSVKNTRAQANPGSFRKHDMADGLYLGGFLNGVPEQYVRFSTAGIQVVSPTLVDIQAPQIKLDGAVTITGDVTGQKGAAFTNDVTAEGTSLHTHTHKNVQPGSGNSGGPN